MNAREAFKTGFLLRCAEQGLSMDQIAGAIDLAIEKVAAEGGGPGFMGYAKSLGGWGLAASAAGGAATGYLAAKATEPDVDPEYYKQVELINALKQQTEHSRRVAARLSMRKPLRAPAPLRLLG